LKQKLAILFVMFLSVSCHKNAGNNLLESLMQDSPEKFGHILNNKDALEVQIIYTQIDRDETNKPSFKTYYFNHDSSKYFYPASTVKLPMVLLAFEKLRTLNIEGLTMKTPMFSDSVYSGQLSVVKDSTSESGHPSVEHYAKKILVVSDNDAFNRLYEFVGQQKTNERMRELGYQARIIHRLERPLSRDENAHTEAVRFVADGKEVYSQQMLVNNPLIEVQAKVFKGKGFYRNDSLINKPFDFTYKNFYPLNEQHFLLQSLIFPETVPAQRRFNISEAERSFVLKYMSQLPGETLFPKYYSDTTYSDAYCKFFLYGSEKSADIPKTIRIFNKVGDAYGYLIDNAYIVDFENGVEFMLSAVINTNTDSIYNDGKYEYETLGFPFMKNLGETILRHEVQRKRKIKPDLSEFKLIYDRE
jgi:hypothetical protein